MSVNAMNFRKNLNGLSKMKGQSRDTSNIGQKAQKKTNNTEI
jgi:hypothetical protein